MSPGFDPDPAWEHLQSMNVKAELCINAILCDWELGPGRNQGPETQESVVPLR